MIKSNELVLFRNLKYQNLFDNCIKIINNYEHITVEDCFACVHDLLDFSSNYNFDGNLFHVFLTYILSNNENAFSLSSEMIGEISGSINNIALHDFKIFKSLFDFDLMTIDKALNIDCFSLICDYCPPSNKGKIFNKDLRKKISSMAKSLKNASLEEFYALVIDFYREFGVSKYGFHKAFRLSTDDDLTIEPITNTESITFDDIVGYDWQKAKLIKNTLDFVEGRKANNVLLYGDSGTGKSSSIKAVLNMFAPKGLRMIEIYKHEFCYLNRIISMIKNRNYKFVIYMDDLSFETFEIDYKYLKAIIEGGLETKPSNVLIYATSNRRHLIRENSNENEDLHRNENTAEKLSLAARFGVSILYSSPDKQEFDNIVLSLAKKNDIPLSESTLLAKAHIWETHYGGFSGRTAAQFINYIKSGNIDI